MAVGRGAQSSSSDSGSFKVDDAIKLTASFNFLTKIEDFLKESTHSFLPTLQDKDDGLDSARDAMQLLRETAEEMRVALTAYEKHHMVDILVDADLVPAKKAAFQEKRERTDALRAVRLTFKLEKEKLELELDQLNEQLNHAVTQGTADRAGELCDGMNIQAKEALALAQVRLDKDDIQTSCFGGCSKKKKKKLKSSEEDVVKMKGLSDEAQAKFSEERVKANTQRDQIRKLIEEKKIELRSFIDTKLEEKVGHAQKAMEKAQAEYARINKQIKDQIFDGSRSINQEEMFALMQLYARLLNCREKVSKVRGPENRKLAALETEAAGVGAEELKKYLREQKKKLTELASRFNGTEKQIRDSFVVLRVEDVTGQHVLNAYLQLNDGLKEKVISGKFTSDDEMADVRDTLIPPSIVSEDLSELSTESQSGQQSEGYRTSKNLYALFAQHHARLNPQSTVAKKLTIRLRIELVALCGLVVVRMRAIRNNVI